MNSLPSPRSGEGGRGASGVSRLPRSPGGRWAKLALLAAIPLVYSAAVLYAVGWSGDIGLRCIFGTLVKDAIPDGYEWTPERPHQGDRVVRIGPQPIRHYTDYVHAIRDLRFQAGRSVEVAWQRAGEGPEITATALVRHRPLGTYLTSVVWFVQELVIFALGAWVYLRRPRDDSARIFFWICIVTVGAYMGGYHWTEIVAEPALIYPFVLFAVFVPVVSLHFALVFPRPNPTYLLHRRLVLGTIYGLALADIAALWAVMFRSKWLGDHAPEGVDSVLAFLKTLAYASIGLAFMFFTLFFACLLDNFFRRTRTRAERNQVRWVLMATIGSAPLIVYLLWMAWLDPSRLGRTSTAWPMFIASLFYTVAYALSITRYKLMQVEEVQRGMVYLLVSVAAGVLYSGFLVLGALVIGKRLLDHQVSTGGLAAGVTAIAFLILTGAMRGPFQKAIDRRFYREKYKFDQAMRKMNLAVGSLVDRATLGRRLLEAASEVLHIDWGAIYLADPEGPDYELVACLGPSPDEPRLGSENPLVERLERSSSIRVPHAMALAGTSDPATDAMIALGGEAAHALESDGSLAGLLVLGPKRSGLPYEDEELAFLGALSSVATLALHSATIQQTLESLNGELRSKVEKIADQQRRILILQDQLTGRAEASGRAAVVDAGPGEAVGSPSAFEAIKGTGAAVRRMIEMARKVAASPSAVLIRGESGTGKEILAEAHPRRELSGRPGVRQGPLRGALAEPARVGAIRPREGLVHRRRPRPHGPVRAGRRRHAFPRRDRRHQPGGPDQAPPRPPGDVVRAGRQLDADLGRREDHRGDAPGPRGVDPPGTVPRGPVLSPERHPAADPLAPRAAGGHLRAGGPLPRPARGAGRPTGDAPRPGRGRGAGGLRLAGERPRAGERDRARRRPVRRPGGDGRRPAAGGPPAFGLAPAFARCV